MNGYVHVTHERVGPVVGHRFDELVLHGIMDLTIYSPEQVHISSWIYAAWFSHYRVVRPRSPGTGKIIDLAMPNVNIAVTEMVTAKPGRRCPTQSFSGELALFACRARGKQIWRSC